MHDLRSASVNNNRLAILAAWHRFHPFMRYFSQKLFGEVAPFVSSVKAAKAGTLQESRHPGKLKDAVQPKFFHNPKSALSSIIET